MFIPFPANMTLLSQELVLQFLGDRESFYNFFLPPSLVACHPGDKMPLSERTAPGAPQFGDGAQGSRADRRARSQEHWEVPTRALDLE